ncbi:MAG: hypothetical protein V3S04_05160, partial [Candidatus Omnitrophota bacterium]
MGFKREEAHDNTVDAEPSGDNSSIRDAEGKQSDTSPVVFGIMNWRAMRWVKIVSIIVIGTFLFQQVVWAADNDISTVMMQLMGQPLHELLPPDVLEKLELESYDLFDSPLDQKKSSKPSFLSPDVLSKSQANRESEMDRKNELEDAILEQRIGNMEADFDKALQSLKSARRSPFEDEDDEPTRALGSAGGGAGSGAPFNFTLSDWDEDGEPEQLDIYNYDDDGTLIDITSYDISEIDKSEWMDLAKEIEGRDSTFFGGYMDDGDLEELLLELEEEIISKS